MKTHTIYKENNVNRKRKTKFYPTGSVLWIILCLLTGCIPNINPTLPAPEPFEYEEELLLEDLAFDRRWEAPYKLQLEENGVLKPYLVLTDDYNGNCLLLREYLLDEPIRYSLPKHYSAYYGDSEIDEYLNGEFLERFSEKVRESIQDTAVEITTKESLRSNEKTLETITRKVFFLSYTEAGKSGNSIYLKEGKPLSFFVDLKSRIAYFENGRASSWWLRTPCITEQYVVCGVSPEGAVGGGPITSFGEPIETGVRPAFCLKRDTKIRRQGEYYVLVLE